MSWRDFDVVAVCSDNEQHLKKIKAKFQSENPNIENVVFLDSKAIISLLQSAIPKTRSEENILGTKVKVNVKEDSRQVNHKQVIRTLLQNKTVS